MLLLLPSQHRERMNSSRDNRIAVDLCLLLILDQITITDEDRENLKSVEILLADLKLFSLSDFEFTNLKWLQSLAAGNMKFCTVFTYLILNCYFLSTL